MDSQSRVAYIADISSVKSVGPFYLPAFNTKGWEKTLEKAARLSFEKVVFTHDPPEIGTMQGIVDSLSYVRD